jgi:hypothetical protein
MSVSTVVDSLTTVVETHTVPDGQTVSRWTASTPAIAYPRGNGEWSARPWVFKNGQEYLPDKWDWSWVEDTSGGPTDGAGELTVTFNPPLQEGDEYTIVWKRWKKGVVPHESDISYDGWSYGMSEEPAVPYVFGEWTFDLTYFNERHSTQQFRCVSQIGLTDINDAYDADMDAVPDHYNMDWIDQEVVFQYKEVFYPFDLWDASHKSSFRWVQKGEIDHTLSEDQWIGLMAHTATIDGIPAWCLDNNHHVYTSWYKHYKLAIPDPYQQPLGRPGIRVLAMASDGSLPPVLLNGPMEIVNGMPVTDQWYYATENTIGLDLDDIDEDYDLYKILYSTYLDIWPPPDMCWASGRWEWIVVGRDSAAVDSAGAAMISAAWQEWKHKEVWLSALDMKETEYGPTVPWVLAIMDGEGSEKCDYKYKLLLWVGLSPTRLLCTSTTSRML